MTKVKAFMEPTPGTVSVGVFALEDEVDKWIAQAEARGAEIIQLAASSGGYGYHTLWVLYKEPKVKR